ncbi:DNA repair protein RadC [bacterium]|nr:DNA repair protein RadC [bacterium]
MNEDQAGHRIRLRERFLNSGLKGFAEHEILEFLLTFTIPRKDTKDIAKKLLKTFKSFNGVLDAPIQDIQNIKGLGTISPVLIKLFKALIEYYLKQRVSAGNHLNSTEDVVNYFQASMAPLTHEEFRVIFLNTKNLILEIETITSGTIDHSVIYPREILKKALNYNAKSIVLVHNHPSGDPHPSESDLELTRKLKTIAELMDINVHDHVIIGRDGYFSLAQEKLI